MVVERTSDTQALILWDQVPAATTYQVELTEPNKSWERLAITTLREYKITKGLHPLTSYQVRVASRNSCGMSFSMVSDIPQFGEVPTKVKEQPESLKLRTLPGDDRRKSINYSVTTVVRELLEGLAKSAESALSVNQGDSTDVA